MTSDDDNELLDLPIPKVAREGSCTLPLKPARRQYRDVNEGRSSQRSQGFEQVAGRCVVNEHLITEWERYRMLRDVEWKHYKNQHKLGQEWEVLPLSRIGTTHVGLLRIPSG